MSSAFWIVNEKPALVLAPMEGVTDAPMRALLTEFSFFTHCVAEFLRISHEIPPEYVFFRHVPELLTKTLTPYGVPVIFQLLGGDPEKMAKAALTAIKTGAQAIDLNFGCPAPTVNRHDGGATLLKYPLRIKEIVKAVRDAVPREFSVSAKLRLGWDTIDAVYENASMAAEGGADWITVHARTRAQGYKPPVFWKPIGELKAKLKVPVIANGDIWTLDDFKRCRDETGCTHFMLGRGAMANPFLPIHIAHEMKIEMDRHNHFQNSFPDSDEWMKMTRRFADLGGAQTPNSGYTLRRLKQWYKMVDNRSPFANFEIIKRKQTLEEFFNSF